MSGSLLIREARRAAGLTQEELGRRAGLTQSVVARLERPGANPTVAVLERALAAAGASLTAVPLAAVDETQLSERLKLDPDQRLRAFERSHRNLRRLTTSARRVRTA